MNPLHFLPAVLVLIFLHLPSQAATVAHWRFEGGSSTWLLDSSGNGHHLTNTGTTLAASAHTLPSTGAGSAFSNPIPQTGAANLGAVRFSGGGQGLLSAPDSPAWTTSTLTIEAYIHLNTVGSLQSIAGHFSGNTDQPLSRSLLFHVTAGNNLSVILNNTTLGSTLSLTSGVDYFVAMSIDFNAPQNQRITFYLQDLTNGGVLQQEFRSTTATALNDSTAGFSIGSTGNPSSPFNGIIDEVRFSNTALSANQLLIAPEPSRSIFLSLGLTLLLTHRRRQHK